MKTAPSVVNIINEKLPEIISLNNLKGENELIKTFFLFVPIELIIKEKTAQKYIVTINFNENFVISFSVIYS